LSDAPVGNARTDRRREWRITGIIFFGIIALIVLWAAFRIVEPFLTAVILGAIIVTVTFPTYRRVRARVHERKHLAATIMLFGITFLIGVPVFVLILLIVQQASGLVERLRTGEAQQMLAHLDLTSKLMWVKRFVPTFDPASVSPQRLVLPVVQQAPGWVAANGAAVLGGLAGLVIGFLMVLLSAYFFYVDGETILDELAFLSPLPEKYDREFAGTFKDVIDATFRGHVITGMAQGLATMVGLLIAQVPAALFWGAVATVMSLLPFVGAAAVWIPAAIYLFIAAAMGKAPYWQPIFLTLYGVLVVSTVDNIVRPWAMKGKSQLPAIPLLFSVLGGMQAFGFVGLVIGPLVFSLVMSIIDIYKRSFRKSERRAAADANI
jgi:predicted PurR-regulated permease PerM